MIEKQDPAPTPASPSLRSSFPSAILPASLPPQTHTPDIPLNLGFKVMCLGDVQKSLQLVAKIKTPSFPSLPQAFHHSTKGWLTWQLLWGDECWAQKDRGVKGKGIQVSCEERCPKSSVLLITAQN